MAASPSRLPRAPEAAAAGKADQGQQPRKLLPAGRGASPFRGRRGFRERKAGDRRGAAREPHSSLASATQRDGGRPQEPRARAPEVSVARGGALWSRAALPASNWRRRERAIPGGPWAEVTSRRLRARDPRQEQHGGQGEEEEGEHLGPLQVHRQDHPREVPGRPGSQRRPERLRPAAQPGAGRDHRVHERSRRPVQTHRRHPPAGPCGLQGDLRGAYLPSGRDGSHSESLHSAARWLTVLWFRPQEEWKAVSGKEPHLQEKLFFYACFV